MCQRLCVALEATTSLIQFQHERTRMSMCVGGGEREKERQRHTEMVIEQK